MNRVISSDRILTVQSQADRAWPSPPAPRQACPAPSHYEGVAPRLLIYGSMTSDRFAGGEPSITQFVLTGECIVGPCGSSLRAACKCSGICSGGSPTVADLLWRMPVLASLAGAKLKLAGFAGFAGCANTLHARGPTNIIKSPFFNLLRPIWGGAKTNPANHANPADQSTSS